MKLKQMLELADLVKFAKTLPLPTENEMSYSNAYAFIQSTAPEEQAVNEVKETEVKDV
jgi:hypothetical protein